MLTVTPSIMSQTIGSLEPRVTTTLGMQHGNCILYQGFGNLHIGKPVSSNDGV